MEQKVLGRPPSGLPFGRPFSKGRSRLTRLLLISVPDDRDRKPTRPQAAAPCSVSLPWGSKLGSVRRGLALSSERQIVTESVDDSGCSLEVEGRLLETPHPQFEEFSITLSNGDAFSSQTYKVRAYNTQNSMVSSERATREEDEDDDDEWRGTYGSSDTESCDPTSPKVQVSSLSVITEHNLSARLTNRLNDLVSPIAETSRTGTSEGDIDINTPSPEAHSDAQDENIASRDEIESEGVEVQNAKVSDSSDNDVALVSELNVDDSFLGKDDLATHSLDLAQRHQTDFCDEEYEPDKSPDLGDETSQSLHDAKASKVFCRASTIHSFTQFEPDLPAVGSPRHGSDFSPAAIHRATPYDENDVRSSATSFLSSLPDDRYLQNTLSAITSKDFEETLLRPAAFSALCAQQVRLTNNEWELNVFQRPLHQPPQMPSWPHHGRTPSPTCRTATRSPGAGSKQYSKTKDAAFKIGICSQAPQRRDKKAAGNAKADGGRRLSTGLLGWHQTRKQHWKMIGKFAPGKFAPVPAPRSPGRAGGWQPLRSPRETLQDEDITSQGKFLLPTVDTWKDSSFPSRMDVAHRLKKKQSLTTSARSNTRNGSLQVKRTLVEDWQDAASDGSMLEQASPRLIDQASEVSLPFVERTSLSEDEDESGPNLAGLRLPSPTDPHSQSQDIFELSTSTVGGVSPSMRAKAAVVNIFAEAALPSQRSKLSRRHTSPSEIAKCGLMGASSTDLVPRLNTTSLVEESNSSKPAVICMSTAADIQKHASAPSTGLSNALRAVTPKALPMQPVPSPLGVRRRRYSAGPFDSLSNEFYM